MHPTSAPQRIESDLVNPHIFREYDIRGTAGGDLTAEVAFRIGHAFGTRVAAEGGRAVCIAYDGRLSSPSLTQALAHGLARAGCAIKFLGLGPTPLLYFGVHMLEADAGVMITGSHNPPDHNGFKFMRANHSFYGEDIQRLYRDIEVNDEEVPPALTGWPQMENCERVQQDYVQRLCDTYGSGKRALRVAWDPGSGATGNIAAELCRRLPGKHFPINTVVDGAFPAHHPDPSVPANLQQLIALVKQEQCDLGLAFDGDGDRVGVVDDEGRILSPDQLIMLYAANVLQKNPGATIIADVKSSQGLFDEIARLGGQPLMWKTGHSLIKAKMKETGAKLAGEQSGHIFFADEYFGFDDGLYAALRLLRLLAETNVKLSQWRKTLPARFSTPEIRLPCAEERKFRVVEEVRRRLQAAGAEFNAIDGVRVQRGGGWWLLRASNTQPMLIARWEACAKEDMPALEQELRAQLSESGVQLPKDCGSEF